MFIYIKCCSVKRRIIIGKIRCRNTVIGNCIQYGSVCRSTVEPEGVSAINVDRIARYNKGLAVRQLDCTPVGLAVSADYAVVPYNEIRLGGMQIDTARVPGNGIALKCYRICNTSEIAALVEISIFCGTVVNEGIVYYVFVAECCRIVVIDIHSIVEGTAYYI